MPRRAGGPQEFGRLPWFALLCLRVCFLRELLLMGSPRLGRDNLPDVASCSRLHRPQRAPRERRGLSNVSGQPNFGAFVKFSARDADGYVVSERPQSVVPLLHALASTNGSDLHCKVGSSPRVRVDGRLRRLQAPELRPADTESMVGEVLPAELMASFNATSEADFAYSLSGVGRFRVNAYRARGACAL